MRIFISAGEPSGDLHGANLIQELRRRCPGVEFTGFGGDRMAQAGCQLLYPLCQIAVMWFVRVLARAPIFLDLISRADRFFRHRRPDAVILIDCPGFNWWMARRAHFHGIPVFYFVPPQLWGWAGWRVKKMRRFVDHVLCNLPFEVDWYRQRGVLAHYVGHPYFDELVEQKLDQDFQAGRRGSEIIGLLPGSRTQEVQRNLSTLVRSARKIHQARPQTRFLAACFRPAHLDMVNAYLEKHPGLPIETCVGRTPEIIEMSRACVAVSGSVSLELLFRGKPSVIVYRVSRMGMRLARTFMTTSHICLVNLLAGKEIYPEFLTVRCPSAAIADRVLGWLDHPDTYEGICGELAGLRQQVARPGACGRAAEFVLGVLARKKAG